MKAASSSAGTVTRHRHSIKSKYMYDRPPDKNVVENYFFLFLNKNICSGYSENVSMSIQKLF